MPQQRTKIFLKYRQGNDKHKNDISKLITFLSHFISIDINSNHYISINISISYQYQSIVWFLESSLYKSLLPLSTLITCQTSMMEIFELLLSSFPPFSLFVTKILNSLYPSSWNKKRQKTISR